MTDRLRRRRIARLVLAFLLLVHLGAFQGYVMLTREQAHRQLFLEGRDAWREGHLAEAAASYRAFVDSYRDATFPFVLSRHFPAESGGWYALGRIEAERGHTEAALADLNRAMALEPGLGRREYRDLLYESGRFEALAAFAAGEATDPASLAAAYDAGAAALGRHEPRAAARAYEDGIARVPAYLKATDPGFHGRLSEHEARLANLASAAWALAGERARATLLCTGVTTRMPPTLPLDRLCRGALAATAGDAAGAHAALHGYLPASPEESALLVTLGEPVADDPPR